MALPGPSADGLSVAVGVAADAVGPAPVGVGEALTSPALRDGSGAGAAAEGLAPSRAGTAEAPSSALEEDEGSAPPEVSGVDLVRS
ncbi:hypothetical protein [Streptomyces sp. NPDC047706]|uniref:hypothetical protein n=1 Tax=Streptomyces sp. NPDC047706 TaxID=3365486 RepID=UPI00371D1111